MRHKIIRQFTKEFEFQRGAEFFNTLYSHYINSLKEIPYNFIEEVIKECIEVKGCICSIDFVQLKDTINITFYVKTEYYIEKEYTYSVSVHNGQQFKNYPMYIILGDEDIVTFIDMKGKLSEDYLKSTFKENLLDVSSSEFSLPISYFCM